MTENDGLRRYVEAGMALTQITRARAEELVRELIKTGRDRAHPRPGLGRGPRAPSRDRSEALVGTVRGEVRQQLKELGFTNIDDLAKKVADILARSSAAARKATAVPPRRAGPKKARGQEGPPARQVPGQEHRPRRPAQEGRRQEDRRQEDHRRRPKKAAAKKSGAKKAGA